MGVESRVRHEICPCAGYRHKKTYRRLLCTSSHAANAINEMRWSSRSKKQPSCFGVSSPPLVACRCLEICCGDADVNVLNRQPESGFSNSGTSTHVMSFSACRIQPWSAPRRMELQLQEQEEASCSWQRQESPNGHGSMRCRYPTTRSSDERRLQDTATKTPAAVLTPTDQVALKLLFLARIAPERAK